MWHNASNRFIPPSISNPASTTVNSIYTPQRILAVWVMRGVSLSATGPGTSALKSCIPPTPRKGRIARDSTMIPIPPIQWVRLRQNRIPWEMLSMSVRVVAPVVVKPDMVSKNASVKEGMAPESIKGRLPHREKAIHPKATTAKPSLGRRSCRNFPNRNPANPRKKVTTLLTLSAT